MILYRFLKREFAVQAIAEKRFKVGLLTELNDPYDCLPFIAPGEALKKSFGVTHEFMDELSKRFLTRISSDWGVLCFCARQDNPVVWSHYADSHQGITLGIEIPDDQVIRVRYLRSRPRVDQDTLGPNIPRKTIEHVFGTKARSWVYEREYRLIVLLKDCDLSGERYFWKFPPDILKSITLGANCDLNPHHLHNILKKSDLEAVPIYQAIRDHVEYKMIPKKLEV